MSIKEELGMMLIIIAFTKTEKTINEIDKNLKNVFGTRTSVDELSEEELIDMGDMLETYITT